MPLPPQVLVPDLLARVHEEWAERRRRPHTLTVKWRRKGAGWQRSSASAPMPLPGPLAAPPGEREAAAVAKAALQLLRQHLSSDPFDLSLINVGVTNIKDEGPGRGAYDTGAFARLLGGGGSGQAGGGVGGGGGGRGGPSGAAPPLAAQPAPDEAGDSRLPAWARALAAASSGSPAAAGPCSQPGGAASQGTAAAAAAAAATAQQQRRDYRRSPQGQGPAAGAPLSKRDERRLREAGGRAAQPPAQQLQRPLQQQPAGGPDLRGELRGSELPADAGARPAKLARTEGGAASSPGRQHGTAAASRPDAPCSQQPADEATGAAGRGAFDLVTIGGEVVGTMTVVEGDEDDEWPDSDDGG
jgi:hypothetical protein